MTNSKKARTGGQRDQIHPRQVTLPEGNRALIPPIYNSVKYFHEVQPDEMPQGFDWRNEFVYSRVSSPTTRTLELALAQFQGEEDGLVFGSGVAALSCVMLTFLQSGDQIAVPVQSYLPTRWLARDMLGKFGVHLALVDLDDTESLKAVLSQSETKMFFFENPTNPVLQTCDVSTLTSLCAKHSVLSVLDNTFATPLHHRGLGIDLIVHSLTKYISGHSDVMGGAVLGSSDLVEQLSKFKWNLGAHLDGRAASDLLRGLKTTELRYKEQSAVALSVAKSLLTHRGVKNVRYPGLDDRDAEIAKRYFSSGAGAVLAFDLNCEPKQLSAFLNALDFIHVAGSLGGVESVIAPCERFYGNDLSAEQKRLAGISPTTLRLSCGLEGEGEILRALRCGFDAVIGENSTD